MSLPTNTMFVVCVWLIAAPYRLLALAAHFFACVQKLALRVFAIRHITRHKASNHQSAAASHYTHKQYIDTS
jgi:hypothetical protein